MPLPPLKERKKELNKRKEDLGKKNDDGTIQIFVYRTILAFLGFANLLETKCMDDHCFRRCMNEEKDVNMA